MPSIIATAFIDQDSTSSDIDTTGANAIVIFVARYSTAPTLTDNKGNIYSPQTEANFVGDFYGRFYICLAPTAGTGHNFSLAGTAGANNGIVIALSGVKQTSPVAGQVGGGFVTSSPVATGALTPSEANCILLACGANYNVGGDYTAINSGFTLGLHGAGNYVHHGYGLAHKVQTTAVEENADWTVSSPSLAGSLMIALKAAPVPDTTVPSDVTGLTATKISNSEVEIDSDTATDNIAVAGYLTQRRIDGGSWVALTPTTKAFQDTESYPTTPGTYSFEYRRKAFDTAETPNYSTNWSSITSPVSITIPVTPPVASFTISAATVVLGGSVVLTDTSSNTPTSRQWKLDGDDIATTTPYSLNTTGLALGTHTIRLDVSNPGGSDYDEQTFEVIESYLIPISYWSCLQLLPQINLLKWGELDTATDGTEVGDFSGHDRKMVCASSPPVLQTDVINGLPALYFDGTKNPLKYTGSMTCKHIFLAVKIDGNFTGNNGILSGVAATSLLRGNGSGTTKFANLSIGSGFVYQRNSIVFAESDEQAPINTFAILELKFPSGITLDGFQIGQDLADTSRKGKFWYLADLVYSELQTGNQLRDIYEYFALKFHIWQKKLNDTTELNILPFAPDRPTELTEEYLAEVSVAEGLRGQDTVVRYLDDVEMKSWNLQFTDIHVKANKALRTFLSEHKLHLPYWFLEPEMELESVVVTVGSRSIKGTSIHSHDTEISIREY